MALMPWYLRPFYHPELVRLAEVVVRTAVIYGALLLALRLAGKRHAGQLSPHDFVLILLVSNAVQNAMVGKNDTVHGGLAAAATLIVLNTLISRFVLRHERVNRFLSGQPTLLVHNGHVIDDHLRREGIRRDELEAQIREHGFDGPEEVKTAIQECDGSISVIGFGNHREHRLPALHRRHRVSRRGRKPGTEA